MREWISELSDWMQEKEKVSSSLFTEEMELAAQEMDSLLQASDQLQQVYSELLGKVDHVSSK